MDPALIETGLVEHVRADGFRYQPRFPVGWMVCDIVDQPKRVAALGRRVARETAGARIASST
jgi:23S rRNA (cytidine2498-2'-O)-methyltransferase